MKIPSGAGYFIWRVTRDRTPSFKLLCTAFGLQSDRRFVLDSPGVAGCSLTTAGKVQRCKGATSGVVSWQGAAGGIHGASFQFSGRRVWHGRAYLPRGFSTPGETATGSGIRASSARSGDFNRALGDTCLAPSNVCHESRSPPVNRNQYTALVNPLTTLVTCPCPDVPHPPLHHLGSLVW